MKNFTRHRWSHIKNKHKKHKHERKKKWFNLQWQTFHTVVSRTSKKYFWLIFIMALVNDHSKSNCQFRLSQITIIRMLNSNQFDANKYLQVTCKLLTFYENKSYLNPPHLLFCNMVDLNLGQIPCRPGSTENKCRNAAIQITRTEKRLRFSITNISIYA